ncbi:MAG TPA: trypsin-like peptidase domain-containing protein [Burkholderiaceae bacterium]|nr:trypsin-like peptidase domain-containing protein [Burkholderiaceae bacterium]
MRRLWLLFSQAVTVVLAIVFVLATLKPAWWHDDLWSRSARRQDTVTGMRRDDLPFASMPGSFAGPGPHGGAPPSFADAVRRAAPAVVSITASKEPVRSAGSLDGLQQYFAGRSHAGAQTGLGSGVLVSPEGYLLTNQHVIEGADDIEVTLVDGRSALAKVVGTDADSDLALLKVSLDGPIPSIPLGDIGRLSVGDPVLAIGNPFNVGQTVTSGIVSALDRNQLGLSAIENFIQTDAAINPGNSGGALVDAQGQLIGINTAIFSRSGGSMGIGFAIPVDIAQEVMTSLIRDGQVTRGWIGVQPRDLTPEFADSFQLPVHRGVLVTGVLRDGPAANAGLKPGDVVTGIGGAKVMNTAQLLRAVGALKPPAVAALEVQRGDQALRIAVPVARRPSR